MNIRNVIKYIKSDLYRYNGKVTLKLFFKEYLLNRGFCFTVWFRLSKVDNYFIKNFAILILNVKRIRYHIDISHRCQIGYGLYIGHSGPLIINSTAIIGNNCNLSQYTTIGSNDDKAAIISDNVYIGPNCCLIENVRIGENVTIGGGSVVTKDLPDNCTAAGNYAKVLNFSNPGRYIINKYDFNEK